MTAQQLAGMKATSGKRQAASLFVLKDMGVHGRVHVVIGPTTLDDASETAVKLGYRFGEPLRIVCTHDMSGPSALQEQRE